MRCGACRRILGEQATAITRLSTPSTYRYPGKSPVQQQNSAMKVNHRARAHALIIRLLE